MKKSILFIATLILIMLSSIVLASQEVIEVKLNDKYIDFTDEQGRRVDPELINDRTMVPMRKIFETLGADIEWDGALRKVTAKTNDKEIVLQIDNTEATLKDINTEEQKTILLDSAPVILNDRTMVPVRFIAESLEKQVGWDEKNRTVVIIDYDEIVKELDEECSNIIQLAKEQTVEISTFEETVSINGTINYKDEENRKNNQKLTVDGTMKIKKSEKVLYISIDTKIKGSGELQDALKENKLEKISVEIIIDTENKIKYVKSSLNDSDKWVKTELDSTVDLEELTGSSYDVDFKNIIALDANALTKDSYDDLISKVSLYKSMLGNDVVNISGKSTKTYKIKWGFEDVLRAARIYSDEELDELFSLGKATLEMSGTIKDGVNTQTTINLDIDWKAKESKESFAIDITAKGKLDSYNKDVKITLPKESEID